MKFYDALQLNPSDLKEKIKASGSRKEKIHYQLALIIRAILLVIFSVVFIAGLNMVFGNENGAMSVVIFCVLLSIRFIDLGYQISHSLINLAISFAILLISPLLMQAVPPVIGFIINFVSIMLITFMVCDQPEMGNGGLYGNRHRRRIKGLDDAGQRRPHFRLPAVEGRAQGFDGLGPSFSSVHHRASSKGS